MQNVNKDKETEFSVLFYLKTLSSLLFNLNDKEAFIF